MLFCSLVNQNLPILSRMPEADRRGNNKNSSKEKNKERKITKTMITMMHNSLKYVNKDWMIDDSVCPFMILMLQTYLLMAPSGEKCFALYIILL